MKNKWCISFPVLFLICPMFLVMTSCIKNPDDSLEGPYIACNYTFNNHSDFMTFYNEFKNFNNERYLVLVDVENTTITYHFHSYGIEWWNYSRYDIEFPNQIMELVIYKNNSEKFLIGRCFDVSLFTSIDQIEMKTTTINNGLKMELFYEDYLLFESCFNSFLEDEEDILLLNEIFNAFERGLSFVY